MTVRVIREPSIAGTTLGIALVNDVFFSWTLEDEVRERKGQPVSAWKVPGETAIPSGRYRVVVSHSLRFNRKLPEVLDVPGFVGIRFHPGNTRRDTEGCLLFGVSREGAAIAESRSACDRLLGLISASASRGESCWLLVENSLSYAA